MKVLRCLMLVGLLVCGLLPFFSVMAQAQQQKTPLIQKVHLRFNGSLYQKTSDHAGFGRGAAESLPGKLFNHRFYLQGGANLFFASDFSLGPTLIWLSNTYERNDPICGIVPPCFSQEIDWSFDLFIPELQLRHHRRRAHSDLYTGMGIGYGVGFVSLYEQHIANDDSFSNQEKSRYRTTEPSLSVHAGYAQEVYGSVSLFLEMGYRWMRTDGFKRISGEDQLHDPKDMQFSLTGPFGSAGLSIRL